MPDLAVAPTPECTSGVVGSSTTCAGEAELKQRAGADFFAPV